MHDVPPKPPATLPDTHGWHAVADACGAYVPGAQAWQANAVLFKKEPAAQGAVALRFTSTYVPAGAARHAVAPADGLYWPAEHGTHAPPLRKVPAGHCEQPVKAALLKEPAAQARQAVAPADGEYWPAGHCAHVWPFR